MKLPFARLVKFAFQDFCRNFWLSLVTIITIMLALLSVNFLIAVRVMADAAVDSVRDKVDISLYFKHNASEPLVRSSAKELESLPQVESIRFVSREEALERFTKEHGGNVLLEESIRELDDNPLGHTLVVKARTPEDYAAILSSLDGFEFSDHIETKNYNDYQAAIGRMNEIARNINAAGTAVIAIFALISALVAFNTMRVIIYTRGEEIGIMKLVGATDGFIRGPFILESVMYSVIAWAAACAVFFQLLRVAEPYLAVFLGGGTLDACAYFADNFWNIFGIQLGILVLLNAVSSGMATRKYMRV